MSASIWRDVHGIPHVEADTLSDLYGGQGVVHATDRALQMLLMRVLVQGRASELLSAREESLHIDTFFRRMNWTDDLASEVSKLTEEAGVCLQRYCDGVNSVWKKKIPWEFKLLGYRPPPWLPEDTLALTRMIGYVTLQQSQAEIERLFVEMVQAGVDEDRLEELFPGILGGLDVQLLRKVTLGDRTVPPRVLWSVAAPRMMASNNWVVAGSRSTTGLPILCNDPHLEGNRLPAVWCEAALHMRDRYTIGGTMPGTPGIIIGRNPDVAWGATYAFLDALDSWIEHCRDGKCFREPNQWIPFRQRRETILRKRREPVEITFYENDHGVLDGNPFVEGYYLATRWAAAQSGAETINRMMHMWHVTSVEDAMHTLGQVESAWNFVLADRHGNIGYQMSGLLPQRSADVSGFVPLPGWKKEFDWRGFVPYNQLPRVLNPTQGYFVTANQDLNAHGQARPINMAMGSYRAQRIARLLEEQNSLTTDDMYRIHFDVLSTQAAQFMAILGPLLPATTQADILRQWDLRYTAESRGAFLFETFYAALRRDVFGRAGIGDEVLDYLSSETGVFVDFYANFDRVLLAETSCWFRGQSRADLYRRVASTALGVKPRPWGKGQQYMLRHLLFGGKVAQVLGFDRGPVTAIGGRATVHQGQIYRSGKRTTTFVPSFRLVVDLADEALYSNLAGGPSDRRFSIWYCSDLPRWLHGQYKQVSPCVQQPKCPFP
jgi:penicillin amidase